MFQSAVDFFRLEKVEIGGTKGKVLSEKAAIILEDFKAEFKRFSNNKYEMLDPDGNVSLFRITKRIF